MAAASYLLQKKEGDYPVDGLNGKLAAFLAQETIPYTKETKKGVAELNLKEGIYELEAENGSAIRMLVNASSSGNIKPGMVMEAFSAFAGVEIPPSAYRIINWKPTWILQPMTKTGRAVINGFLWMLSNKVYRESAFLSFGQRKRHN